MRIALLAPVALPVPPAGYGGTELVVHQLAEGLIDAGHAVTLFASGDSRTPAALRSLLPRALTPLGLDTKQAALPFERAHVAWAFAQARDFDLIHDHTKSLGVTMAPAVQTPVLTTIHNDFTPERRLLYLRHPDHAYVALSRAHADRCPEMAFRGVVYNGLDLGDAGGAIFRARKQNYLLFLGRICEAKGTHSAVAAARLLGIPLLIAGKVDPVDRPYFHTRVAPEIDGDLIRYVGEVTGREKWELLADARCLLFPIAWPEPFGLVMIEAMACGTPVIATRLGSVEEVVGHGVSGWIADDFPGLIAGIRHAPSFSPLACRRWVEQRFSREAMVAGYLDVYARLLAGPPRPR